MGMTASANAKPAFVQPLLMFTSAHPCLDLDALPDQL